MDQPLRPPYWEHIYNQLHEACWSLGLVSYINPTTQTVTWVVDGQRGDEHVATEGTTLNEAFGKLYCLTADNRN